MIIGGLILLLTMPAFAAMTIKGHVYKAGLPLTGVGDGKPVQVIDATGTVHSAPGGAVINGAVNVGESTTTNSESWIKDVNGLFIGRSGSYIRLRAWDGVVADGNFYGYGYAYGSATENIYLGATTDAPRTETIDIICDLKAAAPDQPQPPSPVVSYDADFNPQVTVSYNPTTGYKSEICEVPSGAGNAYVYTFYENSDGTGRNWPYASNSTSITITSATPGVPPDVRSWLLAVGAHSVKTQARNYFGPGSESNPSDYTVRSAVIAGQVTNLGIQLITYNTTNNEATVRLTWNATGGASRFKIWTSTSGLAQTEFSDPGLATVSGAGPDFDSGDIAITEPIVYFQVLPEGVSPTVASRQVAGKFTWLLRKPSTGINSIAFPFTRNWSQPAGANVDDTLLERADNVRSTMPNFEFIGRWDEVNQTDVGYISPTLTPGTNFYLIPGEGYQVSVNADNKYWTIVGVK